MHSRYDFQNAYSLTRSVRIHLLAQGWLTATSPRPFEFPDTEVEAFIAVTAEFESVPGFQEYFHDHRRSVVLVLVCLPACGLHEIGSVSVFAFFLVRKWLPVGLLGDDFRILSSYSCQSTFPKVKVDLGSRGRSWLASPDEYRLCTSKSIPKPSLVVIHSECPGSTADTDSASVYGAFEEAQTASTR